ncbi:mechanosensitive ion channel family protein [Nisaea sp.]|uniref:mechanosensitive ion channel family protein n=1 Tax=Nisaea sp. TaxID=2024842 RepID=UPI002B27608D|nr:mechanosensitive ion channel domain-containing protein [Nisaea sp.]
MNLDTLITSEELAGWLERSVVWIDTNVLSVGNFLQLTLILVSFGVGRLLAPALERLLDREPNANWYLRYCRPVAKALKPLSSYIIWLAFMWFANLAAENGGWPLKLTDAALSLLSAWIIIRLASSLIRNASGARALAIGIWSIAALNILGLLNPLRDSLDKLAFSLGTLRISALGLIEAGISLALFIYLAGLFSRLAERRIASSDSLTPSMRALSSKIVRVLLYVAAFVLALESVGIDLTAFAVFGGAIGLGIGFGLQKVISNLMSGVILLLDRSVKPGDVIAIGDTFGWINTLGARYVSVITRDGIEHLIPNEELISQRVENWSFSNQLIRQKVPIGIDYGADVHKARDLALQAADGVERVLKEPKAVCHLIEFGDNAVVLELRFWINDPQNGVANVRSAVQLRLWDLYHEHGVVFPFPQRDLHLRSSVPIKVKLDSSGGGTEVAKDGKAPSTG